ncbi:MAG TPA: hypothetical protein VIV11_04045, partial [Kofleriaceae bacterium]
MYGAGDNSYGPIFSRIDGAMVSSIYDGDLELCTVQNETCLLSEDWSAMRSDPAFTHEHAHDHGREPTLRRSERAGARNVQALVPRCGERRPKACRSPTAISSI